LARRPLLNRGWRGMKHVRLKQQIALIRWTCDYLQWQLWWTNRAVGSTVYFIAELTNRNHVHPHSVGVGFDLALCRTMVRYSMLAVAALAAMAFFAVPSGE
jgi:hypothetical protein